MPGNLICDHCNKQIGDYINAYFTENNLRNELQRQTDELRSAQQELSRLRSEFEQHIEQKAPSNFP